MAIYYNLVVCRVHLCESKIACIKLLMRTNEILLELLKQKKTQDIQFHNESFDNSCLDNMIR